MSTRGHIRIKQADGTIYPHAIYKHSDCYPFDGCGVMTWLPQIVTAFHKNRGDDAEYCVAQIIRHAAIQDYIEWEKRVKTAKAKLKKNKTASTCPLENYALNFTGWGVCSEPHGDEAYIYTVDLKDGSVTYTSRY